MKLLAFARIVPLEGGQLNIAPRQPYYRDVLRADPCAYCGDILSPREQAWQRQQGWDYASVDHIKPRHRGGSTHQGADNWTNLTGCCGRCNFEKGIKSLLRFLIKRHNEQRKRNDRLQHLLA